MIYTPIVFSISEVLFAIVPLLLTVAFVTLAERKTMASMQRRLGPNIVGIYGILQPFADALKLLLKEYVSPTQSNYILFFLGPVITLNFSLLGFSVVPYGPGLSILDFDLEILYVLAMSSLSTYGILLAGWSANSKYAFLGSLRSTAQLISYELILSSAILLVVLLSGSLNLTSNVESQKSVWYIIPLFPVFIIFFIGCIAETNRAPFDLAEAESELVSGFMTEHAAVIFVFFFLAEYASIVLICILTSLLFLGGYVYGKLLLSQGITEVVSFLHSYIQYTYYYIYTYMFNIVYNYSSYLYLHSLSYITDIIKLCYMYYICIISLYSEDWNNVFMSHNFYIPGDIIALYNDIFVNYSSYNSLSDLDYINMYINRSSIVHKLFSYYEIFNISFLEGFTYALILSFKTCIMIFVFIWARASYPRIRYDQLMSFCWTVLLPLVIGIIILYPCLLTLFCILPCSNILALPSITANCGYIKKC